MLGYYSRAFPVRIYHKLKCSELFYPPTREFDDAFSYPYIDRGRRTCDCCTLAYQADDRLVH